MKPVSTWWRRATSGTLAALAGLLFFHTVSGSDWDRALTAVRAAGPPLLLGLAPFFIAMLLDTASLRALLAALDERPTFACLLRIRLGIEALHTSLPGGAVVADSLSPVLLARHAEMPTARAVAALATRKWLVLRGHAAYLAVGALVGRGALVTCGGALAPGLSAGLPIAILASALVPFGLAALLGAAIFGGSAGGRLHRWLLALPHAGLRAGAAATRRTFEAMDESFGRLARSPARRRAGALVLGAWLMEATESLLFARLLGIDVGPAEVLAFEAGLSLLRSAAVFAPAGLGVQDAGYALFFRALGVPDAEAAGAAFLLVKRGKDLVWIAIGYACLGTLRRRSAPVTARTTVLAASQLRA